MTQHEKLKAICEKIGYQIEFTGNFIVTSAGEILLYKDLKVREIIFTQEFMVLFTKYMYRKLNLDDFSSKCFTRAGITSDLCLNLDDPVDYIYNLLGLGEK